jgi:hypothetical protein
MNYTGSKCQLVLRKLSKKNYKKLPHYLIEVIDKMKKLDNFIRESLKYNTHASKKFQKI